ncbi:uncharacterized protein LOC117119537 [Anneissia japonica]|uniref:uncharacterized protein LOC117119537 n=1 Tax=Anneissia japonica TaxID=1529436 RepID=UPI0014259CAD|nr:uncharacterized protein LOC117119537 [Anneissia japonica]
MYNLTIENRLSKRVFDYTQSRFYFNDTIFGINQTVLIEDFNQNLTWTIDPVAQTCQRTYLPWGKKQPTRCIPGNAQYRDQINNPGDVLVSRWRFDRQTSTLNGTVSRGYTINECLPTRGAFVGTEDIDGAPVETLSLENFNNFEVLTDVSTYFNLPSYC